MMQKNNIINKESMLLNLSNKEQRTNLVNYLIVDISENIGKIDNCINREELTELDDCLLKILSVCGMFGLEKLHLSVNKFRNKILSLEKKQMLRYIRSIALETISSLQNLLPLNSDLHAEYLIGDYNGKATYVREFNSEVQF
jgi:HPt (histidine-containing phosphotransfer) domain-containing protein